MDQGEELKAFGSLLRKMREAKEMTRQELAQKVGCKYEDIRLYEKGERVMRIDHLFRILNVLGIRLSKDLFDIEVYEAAAGLTCLEEKNRKNLMSKICSMIAKAGKSGKNTANEALKMRTIPLGIPRKLCKMAKNHPVNWSLQGIFTCAIIPPVVSRRKEIPVGTEQRTGCLYAP